MGRPPKKKIALTLRDWNGKTVYLDKDTWRDHIARLHLEDALLTETLKANFSTPKEVRDNPNAKSQNAIYDIPCNGKPFLVVIVKERSLWGTRVISSFYSSEEDRLPKGKVIWKRK